MGVVEEEADEAQLWLELIGESDRSAPADVSPLREEAGQLVAIVVASIRTARQAGGAVPRSTFRVPRSA